MSCEETLKDIMFYVQSISNLVLFNYGIFEAIMSLFNIYVTIAQNILRIFRYCLLTINHLNNHALF